MYLILLELLKFFEELWERDFVYFVTQQVWLVTYYFKPP